MYDQLLQLLVTLWMDLNSIIVNALGLVVMPLMTHPFLFAQHFKSIWAFINILKFRYSLLVVYTKYKWQTNQKNGLACDNLENLLNQDKSIFIIHFNYVHFYTFCQFSWIKINYCWISKIQIFNHDYFSRTP